MCICFITPKSKIAVPLGKKFKNIDFSLLAQPLLLWLSQQIKWSMVDLSTWAPIGMYNHQMKIFGQPFWRYQLAYTAHSAQYHWPSKRAGPKKFQFYLLISLLQWWRMWGKQCWHPKNCTFLQILAHYVLWHLYWQTKRKKPEQKKIHSNKNQIISAATQNNNK